MAALVLKTEEGFIGIPCHAIIGVDLSNESLYVSMINGDKVLIVKGIKNADTELPTAIVDVSDNGLLRLFQTALGN